MQVMEHYVRLRQAWPEVGEGEDVEVTVGRLAEVLCCTSRNVNLMLKRMVEEGWLTWTPGNGRGHRSRLAFRVSVEEMRFRQAKRLVQRGDVDAALAELEGLGRATGRFWQWLGEQFGPRVEVVAEREVETLCFPYFRRLLSLDPAEATRQTELHLVRQVFDGLVTLREESGAVEPHLAHHWEMEEDGRVWTFYLRKGVLFHHGREMTAEDVRGSLLRLGRQGRLWFAGVTRVDVVGRYAVRVELEAADHLFLKALGMAKAAVVPLELCGEDSFGVLPVGTGPFRVVRNDERMVVLEAFPAYFRGRAHLDRVEIWLLPSAREFVQVEKANYLPFVADGSKGKAWADVERRALARKYLTFHLGKEGPQRSLKFRRAVGLVVNRERMVEELGENRVRAEMLFRGEGGCGVVDRELARRLVEESGYRGEAVTLFTYRHVLNEQDAAWIRARLGEIGVRVEVEVLPYEELLRMENVEKADMILTGDVREGDAELSLWELFAEERSLLCLHLEEGQREEIRKVLAACGREPSRWMRLKRLEEIEARLQREEAFVVLYSTGQRTWHHPELCGVTLNAFGFVPYQDVWLQRRNVHAED